MRNAIQHCLDFLIRAKKENMASKMTVKQLRRKLEREINWGGSESKINALENELERIGNWPEDLIITVRGLKAKNPEELPYTSRVDFCEATQITGDHLDRIRSEASGGFSNGVCLRKGIGWIVMSGNSSNVHHAYETLKWDFRFGLSSIKEGEKVFILPRNSSEDNFAIMATAGKDAYPLSKSTQDPNWVYTTRGQ